MDSSSKIITLFFSIILLMGGQCYAYSIDGLASDWNITLGSASEYRYYLNNHLPSGGRDIDFTTEDIADIFHFSTNVGPGSSTWNTYDAEAMYFDNDDTYAYLAIITGLPANNLVYKPGDIFIDTGKYQDPSSSYYDANELDRYEFGIAVETGNFYDVDAWDNALFIQHKEANPWRIDSSVLADSSALLASLGSDFVYGSEIYSHYVIEAKIPLSLLGLDPYPNNQNVWLSWTMGCGNDYLKLVGDLNVVPEPMNIFLLGTGLLGLLGIRKKIV